MVPEALQELPICFDFRAERQNATWSPQEESYIALLSTASAIGRKAVKNAMNVTSSLPNYLKANTAATLDDTKGEYVI